MVNKTLKIGHLYGDYMNTYGDLGNIIDIQRRCQWRGIDTKVENLSLGYKLKKAEFDLFFFGGGQDQAQKFIAADLLELKGEILKKEVEQGVPLLAICGGYQLLGEYYQPQNEEKIPGLNIFPVTTAGSSKRMIGNIIIKSQFGNLVGFENHSGQTQLKPEGIALGKVIKGFGNNGKDHTEGCMVKNAIGCYMHGSLLPKNPVLTDWLIQKALEHKYQETVRLDPLNDSLENKAHDFVIKRFG